MTNSNNVNTKTNDEPLTLHIPNWPIYFIAVLWVLWLVFSTLVFIHSCASAGVEPTSPEAPEAIESAVPESITGDITRAR